MPGSRTTFTPVYILQLEAGFENYLTRVHGSSETGSSLTSTDLTSLGEFVCGASVSVISNIPSSSYQ